jgi:4-hydroxy-tetrahydrodipicolinate reductase
MKESPVRVLLVGAAGRMGRTIVGLARNDPKIEIAAQCDRGDAIEPAMAKSNVTIDFSHADAIDEICRASREHRQPLVIGTTGHSAAQREKIERAAKEIPIVFAANFGVGVNVLFVLARKAAELLGNEFEIEIVETHHRMKKDAPSGTAKTIAEMLRRARKIDNEIPIRSIREGDVVGEHTAIFNGPGERVELTHRAASREIFAGGALRAAQWIVGKTPGLYSMEDVLGLKL